ncbi:MAG TPA: ABC transporter permease subunit [Vicinamibacteria bacterium]|nr:ABC transporter permease subunit [Vicinamibacteria bacterium]
MSRRASSLGPIDLGLLGSLFFVVPVVLLGSSYLRPYDAPELDPRPALLPLYLLLSLARLGAAYGMALLAALATGYLAARSAAARRIILPSLDVLQSVPILGFFPVAVGFFIGVFHGSALGVECAAVFLIFTSMFWNLAFGVYESLITLPEDLVVAADQIGLRGSLRWSRLILPAVMPGVLYNSLVSWANGWYFLIASEIIAVGPARYTLPGLGSYLAQSVVVGRHQQTLLAILVLLATTVGMHLLLWGPLDTWAERFRFEESGGHPRTPPIARALGRSRIVRWVTRKLVVPSGQQALTVAGTVLHAVTTHSRLVGVALALAVPLAVWGLGRRLYLLFVSRALSPEIRDIPLDLVLSFLRVALGVAVSAALAIPVAYAIACRPRWRGTALAVIQIFASIPATAFFPLIVVLLTWGLAMNGGTVLLALTTMFWYVLFNVLGATTAIPKEMQEAALTLGLGGRRYLWRVVVPAVIPGLITGSVTAWGAGWNALILCEYIEAGGRVFSVRGIGATLDRANYGSGDMQVVAASLLAMVLLIVAVNRLFWDPLYQRAARRYKMDA